LGAEPAEGPAESPCGEQHLPDGGTLSAFLAASFPEPAHGEELQLQALPELHRHLRVVFTGYAHEELARDRLALAAELRLHLFGEPRQTERVRDVRATLTEQLGGNLVGVAVTLDQRGDRLGLLEGGQILSLEVLEQRDLERVLHVANQGRQPLDTRELCRAETALAGEQLEAVRPLAEDDRLQEAVALDGAPKLGQLLRVEVLSRLVGVRSDLA